MIGREIRCICNHKSLRIIIRKRKSREWRFALREYESYTIALKHRYAVLSNKTARNLSYNLLSGKLIIYRFWSPTDAVPSSSKRATRRHYPGVTRLYQSSGKLRRFVNLSRKHATLTNETFGLFSLFVAARCINVRFRIRLTLLYQQRELYSINREYVFN